MRKCKPGCVWENGALHQEDTSRPCETKEEVEARREKVMPGYKEKLKEWLS